MKLRAALPKGDGNGLTVISRPLTARPDQVHVVIALVKTEKLTTNVADGQVEATLAIRGLEVVTDEDQAAAFRLLERSLERRTGQTMLPLELEDDIRAAFSEVDIDALMDSPDDGSES
ncbi:MAG TPA: hypothetical protein VGH54_21295 [Mycobacterium sp.]|jgi:hypothetical protein|uniref:hypothetical protein n=1 Tax=Mycobacterium sp. TaxID=1785 RepID=UPI002F42F807